ncbi:hypothetical protein AgCh_016373 [Apium graveolens]
MAIKKNRRIVFVQEYEKFNAKADESITHIYDRFLTLLNDLLLVVKDYGREDSNSKFQRALREDWDTQASILRHYSKRESSRRRKVIEKSDPDTESSDLDTDTDEDSDIKSNDPQVIEMEAMLVKGFRMMRLAKPQRKCGFNKKYSRDGKGKFIRNEGQYSKGRKFDKVKFCGNRLKWFKHHILHLGTNKTVCTDCVIYLHAPSLCPVCFTVHENPEKLITSNVVVSCVRCYSSSHVNCIGSHPHAPYLCVMCLNHNSPLLVLGDSNGGKTVDKNAAKIFLAACKISAGSMNKAAVTAKMEKEARAKEAIDARELALKAIEHVEHLRRNSAST